MNKKYAIIVAAGKGTRMNCKQNKVFLDLKGKPILYYTIKTFEDNENIDNIILVLSEAEIEYCMNNIINKYGIKKVCKIVKGGPTRQNSVMNGLLVAEECDLVLIHDGARPFIDNKIIDDGIKYAKIYGACACGVKPKDTIKIKSVEGFSEGTLKRDTLFSVQTPQCFKYDLILNAHKEAMNKGIDATDDTALAEENGDSVYLYEGSYNNIKITTPEDLIIGEKILYNYVDL
ncbi:2-C-methyl-D-erythritol 4-phosphate cytidylyltransferase [Clostridium homopropionicum DSM 5847]|uniref:2-C-methyl-D-erythritol 4-phosphate cytidylyltransferase n=1 Tax=Clostridium homopropionicum DSM 5847 TaxID=1121318 RepID=A0A0L6ZAV5_9CLOT|nr:2-C-methyl-D-erythritol 4-phosphate cytidylyltransferase [Clostridium homopropionicum]KOA19923.1 2-C-methyl-D-erythritol 4-phosphate cytidylyltransferase [Clostridium homopropionicum DSM 5847]SFG87572.1 2-C-methyl-D-erythritol 4-phosphate cytidylyltransferase [Clostridium homopropionicum]